MLASESCPISSPLRQDDERDVDPVALRYSWNSSAVTVYGPSMLAK